MNMVPIRVHEGDDLPDIFLKIFDQDGGVWLDISDSDTVVTAKFREAGTSTVLQTITASKISGGTDGIVKVVWPTDALDDLDPGMYEIEVSISFDGKVKTANKYAWCNDPERAGKKLLVRVLEDF